MYRQFTRQILICSAFLIVGTLIFIFGIQAFIESYDHSDEILTTGTITDIHIYKETRVFHKSNAKNIDVYVQYRANGRSYETVLHYRVSSFREGKELDIYYDKNDPRNIRVKGLEYFTIFYPLIGLITMLVAFLPLRSILKKIRISENLKKTEKPIYAEYDSITLGSHMRLNRAYPYIILCKWRDPATGEGLTFKSRELRDDPTALIEERHITHFPVYLHPQLRNYYVVDLKSLSTNGKEPK